MLEVNNVPSEKAALTHIGEHGRILEPQVAQDEPDNDTLLTRQDKYRSNQSFDQHEDASKLI